MYIENVLQKIEEKKGRPVECMGNDYSCYCPAHDDQYPSLSASPTSDGTILLKCQAGCNAEQICAALGLKFFDLFPNKIEQLQRTQQQQQHRFHQKTAAELIALDLHEFLNREIPERKMILSPIIPTQGLCLLYSKRGIGKTFLSLAIGYAVAAGVSLLRWSCEQPVPVLYVDGEMPAASMQERLAKLVAGAEAKLPDPSYFRIVTPDLQEGGIPDIATQKGQQLLESVIGDAKLVIFDNLSTLAPSLKENESDDWAPFQSWILKLRKHGLSVLLVHHAGKSGKQRGTSRREDVLDSVIVLKRGEGCSASEDAVFEVHFEKARGFYGEEAEPFVATLNANQEGVLCWSWANKEFQDDLYDEVIEGINSGKSYRTLAQELDVSKAKIEGIVKKARLQGDLAELNEAK